MPTLSMFFGIIIRMYKETGAKHNCPHIHAEYGNYNAVFDLDANMIEGDFPIKQSRMVQTWVDIHKDELEADWKLLSEGEQAFKISPLR